jgi:ferredoxin
MKQRRKIIQIEETKCDGCGLCVTACAEGALAIINGKARLLSDTYCDGLGNCLGECPQGAISILEREAEPFVEEDVIKQNFTKDHLAQASQCTTSQITKLTTNHPSKMEKIGQNTPFQLLNWPIQLMLMPVNAPYLSGADLVISADCAPFAYPRFHEQILNGRPLIIACPKLDDAAYYVEKLTKVFELNTIRSIHIVFMEVPCCNGLKRIVQTALQNAKKDIPITYSKIGIMGSILDDSSSGT